MDSEVKSYKLLCVDEEGKQCNVDLQALISYISSKVRTICTEVPDEWAAKRGMFFREKFDILTNLGIYTKVSNKPSIITISKFYDSDKNICERLIFLSKDRSGATYRSPDGKQHPNTRTVPFENDIWYYNISKDDIKVGTDSKVTLCSNYIFENEKDCVINVLKTSELTTGKYYTIFPEKGEIAVAVGALYPDDVMSAPIIFDNKGNLACNSLIELSKER